MIKTTYLRRHYINESIQNFEIGERILEIGSGKKFRYFQSSITINIDVSTEPDCICNAESMPFKDECFDTILCNEVLEHTNNPQALIDECHRILCSGGKMLLTVPFCFEIHDTRDYWRFTKIQLERMFKDYKKVIIKENGGKYSVIFHFLGQTKLGSFRSVLNNIGFYLDKIFKDSNNRICLGYSIEAYK